MDKTVLKNFAVNSRNKLIEDTIYRLNLLGITENEIQDPIEAEGMQTFQIGSTTFSIYDNDIRKRKEIIKEVESKGFNNFIEEVAYTWFNRIVAIRYMEVNNYLPTKTRVLSSEIEGKIEPDILTEALDIDLDYTQDEKEQIFKLKDENKLDELFRFLFIKQCNKLNEILPGLFKTTNDSLELLLNISFTSEESVVRQLIDNIPEEDFTKQVEIIGWLYQYYISEKKDQVININKSNIKKEDIPAATQLFTTDWVVKYMVDNSLGRYWLERNPDSSIKEHLEYYLGEAEQDEETQRKLDEIRSENINVEELTFFDPCMGSGHILVYAFDVFFEIYKELGYLERDIPELILKNNIFGLDIDDRAYQLAYFAVLMKARKYDRKILKKGIVPNVYAIQESGNITDNVIEFIQKNDSTIVNDIIYLKEIFESGKEFGSLIQVKSIDLAKIKESLQNILEKSKSTLSDVIITDVIKNDLFALVNQAELLSQKYSAVVTNPPYMNKFEKNLKDFAKKYYKDYSKDLFSMFISRNFDFCNENGYNALMTPFVWMFIKDYKNLRSHLINNKSISSLIQLEYSAFSEATVPICTFVLSTFNNYTGIYLKLSEFSGGMEVQKEKVLESINNPVNYKFKRNMTTFKNIPETPISFWINNYDLFNFPKIKKTFVSGGRTKTHNNKKYVRKWWEINLNNEWEFYANGGKFKRWYGNHEDVIKWSNESKSFYKSKGGLYNEKFWYKEGICWNLITSSVNSFRIKLQDFHYSSASPTIFNKNSNNHLTLLGFLNSNVSSFIIKLFNPTLNTTVGNILNMPLKKFNAETEINKIVLNNIHIVKRDYDDYETSVEFKTHPFIKISKETSKYKLKDIFEIWQKIKIEEFNKLKNNEKYLNQIFIGEYELQEEVSNNIPDKHISVRLANYKLDVKSLISYTIGCMFGRYSLNNEGLQYHEGSIDLNKYIDYIPDEDNIIPLLDSEYFEDDIINYFINFIKTCFREENIEENLNFIANALDENNKNPRETIRKYVLNHFFEDHVKTYLNCPIYWQFSSGKQNGFNCLVYMHRYEPSLVARIRTDYLHKTQKAIEQRIKNNNTIIKNSTSKQEVAKATKEKAKLQKQLKETQEYDEVLAHIANQNIEIDLDDGVKVNYAKFQNIEIKKEGSKTKKVNLLKKI